MVNAPNHEDDLDWKNRRLCIDGNCIGVIGPDGRCKECGKPSGDDLPPPSSPVAGNEQIDAGSQPAPPPNEILDDEPVPVDTEDIPEDDFDAEWENRRLCPNGSCIGVIGPDGLCKECGKPFDEGDDQ